MTCPHRDIARAQVFDFHCYNSAVSSVPPRFTAALALLMFTGAMGLAAQEREPSHVERFSDSRVRSEDAEREATAALARAPGDVEALVSRARARLQMGKSAEGLSDFERAATLAPARADVRAQLALGQFHVGRFADAKVSAEAALALEPENPAARYALGLLLLSATTDLAGAIQHLERAVARGPATPEVRFDLLRAYVRRGDRVRSTVQYRVLRVLLPPGDSRLAHSEGLLAALNGRFDQAVSKFREAAQGKPELPMAAIEGALAIARGLARQQKFEQAFALFQEAIRRFPESVESHEALATALDQAGRADQARAARGRMEQLIRKLGVASPSAPPQTP